MEALSSYCLESLTLYRVIMEKGERVRITVGSRGRGRGRWEKKTDRWTKTPRHQFLPAIGLHRNIHAQQGLPSSTSLFSPLTYVSSWRCSTWHAGETILQGLNQKVVDWHACLGTEASQFGMWFGLQTDCIGTSSYLVRRWLPHL